MQRSNHGLELVDLASVAPGRAVARLGREVADRVVAPVVDQSSLDQVLGVHEVVDRHQLDRGHAQLQEVVGDRRMAEGGVGPAELLGDLRVTLGEPLHVGLVDDRVGPAHVGAAVVSPGKEGVDDDAAGDVRRRVQVAPLVVALAEHVAEHLRTPLEGALDRLRVGVEEELGRVAADALSRLVGTVDPVPVALAGTDAVDVAVPAEVGALGELIGRGRPALGIEEDQLHPVGVLGEEGEVGPLAVPGGAERRVAPGPGGPQAACPRVVDIAFEHKRCGGHTF